jgi:hypothetical protein
MPEMRLHIDDNQSSVTFSNIAPSAQQAGGVFSLTHRNPDLGPPLPWPTP